MNKCQVLKDQPPGAGNRSESETGIPEYFRTQTGKAYTLRTQHRATPGMNKTGY